MATVHLLSLGNSRQSIYWRAIFSSLQWPPAPARVRARKSLRLTVGTPVKYAFPHVRTIEIGAAARRGALAKQQGKRPP
ncbi:hypothetical protein C241_25015 [Bradyrhizobium lupini HPC(L)]|uniref:Uncharacterized protein n=1 Tax=Bradyrhizobium lupini HPC(L) TaxID=1229491 RepID=A0ABP2RJP5_RHILU|nr:hypothetical protein C241_25015 [Bradyrhizobium lupini HPC(L)]